MKNIPGPWQGQQSVRTSDISQPYLGSTLDKTSQAEDDGSLVLLDHLDGVEEGEGERGDDEKEGDDGHEVTAEAGSLITG